jgi:acyl-CoA thioesterase I
MFNSLACRVVATLLAVLASIALPGAGEASASDDGRHRLLILGDSLSAEYGIGRGTGWVALLSRRLAEQNRPYAVVNASISGDTTSGGRARLPELLARHRPAVVVIELGGNDALRGLPLANTQENLSAMVQASKQAGARPVLVGMMMPPNYGRAYAEQFAGIYRRVADSEKVPLVPFLLDGIGESGDYFLPDRIHPAEKAQPRLLENVWPVLQKVL